MFIYSKVSVIVIINIENDEYRKEISGCEFTRLCNRPEHLLDDRQALGAKEMQPELHDVFQEQ